MEDLAATIHPKSDQLNSDDLWAGPMTITVRKVTAQASSEDQPVSIYFEGDNNKPYKPNKSMRRLLVAAWKADGTKYVGRSMTLYRDEKVTWGGLEVGGIRISHLSHIDKPLTFALRATKNNSKPYTVKPLVIDVSDRDEPDTAKLQSIARNNAKEGRDALQSFWKTLSKPERAVVSAIMDELKLLATKADEPAADDPPDHLPEDDYDGGNIGDVDDDEVFK